MESEQLQFFATDPPRPKPRRFNRYEYLDMSRCSNCARFDCTGTCYNRTTFSVFDRHLRHSRRAENVPVNNDYL